MFALYCSSTATIAPCSYLLLNGFHVFIIVWCLSPTEDQFRANTSCVTDHEEEQYFYLKIGKDALYYAS